MKKLSLSICLTFAFFVTAAVAQTTPGGSQGTQQSSPGMSQPSQQPGMSQPDNPSSGQMGQTDQNNPNQNRTDKGEKKLKGCVQSQGGQYMLETKKGKAIALTGQDVSAHVGHEVEVKGAWASGSSSAVSSTGNASGSEKTFNVASVEMKSESCGGKHAHSDNMGAGSTGSSPTGSSPGSSTGNSTTPPQ